MQFQNTLWVNIIIALQCNIFFFPIQSIYIIEFCFYNIVVINKNSKYFFQSLFLLWEIEVSIHKSIKLFLHENYCPTLIYIISVKYLFYVLYKITFTIMLQSLRLWLMHEWIYICASRTFSSWIPWLANKGESERSRRS